VTARVPAGQRGVQVVVTVAAGSLAEVIVTATRGMRWTWTSTEVGAAQVRAGQIEA
jgi:hypothetical protein